jgi:CDP-diacylglycerol--serine O-phosphatidyltransferase
MNRKWLFVLPNLFTVSSIFCGIYAITLASGASGATASADFARAAISILFGMFFDGCDGRVARLTRTQSEFGVQLDSLADVISFGAAPAILLYRWSLHELGFWGVLVAGVYASCGALRLARFNVMSSKETGPSNYFTGLPIPLAAGVVVAIVIAVTQAVEPIQVTPIPVAVVTLLISYLMVSTVKYHSFKKVKFHARELMVFAGVIVVGAVVAMRIGPNFVLLAYASGYVALGLVEEVIFHKRRREALQLASSSPVVMNVDADADEDDEDDS